MNSEKLSSCVNALMNYIGAYTVAGPRIVSPSLHIRQKRGGKGVIHTHNRTTKAPVTLKPNTEGLDSLKGSKNQAVVLLFKTISFPAFDQKNSTKLMGVKLFLKI